MDYLQIFNIVCYILFSASIFLKYVYPLTKNKYDDKAYGYIIKILRFIAQDSNIGIDKELKIKILKK